jgi:hypothetical protein
MTWKWEAKATPIHSIQPEAISEKACAVCLQYDVLQWFLFVVSKIYDLLISSKINHHWSWRFHRENACPCTCIFSVGRKTFWIKNVLPAVLVSAKTATTATIGTLLAIAPCTVPVTLPVSSQCRCDQRTVCVILCRSCSLNTVTQNFT